MIYLLIFIAKKNMVKHRIASSSENVVYHTCCDNSCDFSKQLMITQQFCITYMMTQYIICQNTFRYYNGTTQV